MELPKHTTQVGTIAVNKKMYIEDYCISYMKQLAEVYPQERKQIALFGTIEREKNVEYAFCYGAALLGCGKGRTDSLTNTQKEEAESHRQENFADYQLIGVVIAVDQVDENIYWIGNGNKAILLDGYYIFYDRNETMLNFMMQNQTEERGIDLDPVIAKKADMEREKQIKKEKEEKAQQEAVQQKKGVYRQKLQKAEKAAKHEKGTKKSVFPAAACVLVVAIAGIYGMKTDMLQQTGLDAVRTNVSDWLAQVSVFSNSYLDTETEETLLALTTEMEGENLPETVLTDAKDSIVVVETQVPKPETLNVAIIPEVSELESTEVLQEPEETKTDILTTEQTETTVTVSEEIQQAEPKSYLIQKGDSLIRILRTYYGDESLLDEVCSMNHIADPDNIQVGQTILLP